MVTASQIQQKAAKRVVANLASAMTVHIVFPELDYDTTDLYKLDIQLRNVLAGLGVQSADFVRIMYTKGSIVATITFKSMLDANLVLAFDGATINAVMKRMSPTAPVTPATPSRATTLGRTVARATTTTPGDASTVTAKSPRAGAQSNSAFHDRHLVITAVTGVVICIALGVVVCILYRKNCLAFNSGSKRRRMFDVDTDSIGELDNMKQFQMPDCFDARHGSFAHSVGMVSKVSQHEVHARDAQRYNQELAGRARTELPFIPGREPGIANRTQSEKIGGYNDDGVLVPRDQGDDIMGLHDRHGEPVNDADGTIQMWWWDASYNNRDKQNNPQVTVNSHRSSVHSYGAPSQTSTAPLTHHSHPST